MSNYSQESNQSQECIDHHSQGTFPQPTTGRTEFMEDCTTQSHWSVTRSESVCRLGVYWPSHALVWSPVPSTDQESYGLVASPHDWPAGLTPKAPHLSAQGGPSRPRLPFETLWILWGFGVLSPPVPLLARLQALYQSGHTL